ncbi:MAG: single-stranded-DNA-specific exonuclease RecJ, partial [Coriobacteriia bacterium]|nr:single-stranded-DNA-specific exonuclease RecJ [Coriobacteriia bacterium]
MQKNTDIDTGLAPLWLSQQTDPLVVDSLAAELGVGSLLATVLASRGLADPGQARAFLDSSLATEDFDAAGIEGLSAVAQALAQAIGFKKRILVFGDYDVDGVSATALLYLALRELSAEALALIPSRMDDGYGLTDQAVVKILAQKPDVLVTVDCGISDREQVFKLVEKGIEVLVTDHHEAGGNVPENVLVADPKLSPGSFGQNLAGAGVALALVRLLGEALGSSGLWEEYIDLACLGTIADQMPLTGFNRALVRAGLDQVNNRPRPGILAMLELQAQAGTSPQTNYTASDLAFGLIPRLNAPGRLGRADQAFEALTTDDPGRARELAEALMQLNEERRRIEAQLSAEALSQAATVFKADSKLVVVSSEGFHEGIRGIVASRLASHFGVPAIVFTVVDGEARGSGRSVGDVNLFAALEAVSHLTLRHGGHESAIGVTVALDDLQRFSTELEKQLALVPPTHFHPPLRVDAQISLGQLDWQGILDLALLEPFGQANPEPLFVSAASQVTKPRTVGNSNTHLSFSALEKGTERAAIWFNCPRIEEFLSPSGLYELVFEPRAELWRNRQNIQLRVREAYHLDGDAALEAAFPELHKGLYDSQNEGLELLAQGRSPLVLMPTGRGKSLIFQLHAARLALKENTASIFVYPLRALINDQQRSLLERFASIGIESQVLCGLNTAEERAETYARLAAGKISVLLTTPEFLMLHAARIAQCTEVGFIAFDEAHHIASSRQFRPAYQDLGEVRRHFPAAQVMAATATADDSWALRIERELRLDSRVVDKARRLNLKLIDLRGTDDRLGHIVGTIQTREPAIVYTYS